MYVSLEELLHDSYDELRTLEQIPVLIFKRFQRAFPGQITGKPFQAIG